MPARSLELCPTLSDPLDCSPPGSFVHGILQARLLEWVAVPSSRGSSQPRDSTCVSCTAGWACREAHTGSGWAPNPTWLTPLFKGELWIQTRRGALRGLALSCHESRNSQQLQEAAGTDFPWCFQRPWPWSWDFQPLRLWDNEVLLKCWVYGDWVNRSPSKLTELENCFRNPLHSKDVSEGWACISGGAEPDSSPHAYWDESMYIRAENLPLKKTWECWPLWDWSW